MRIKSLFIFLLVLLITQSAYSQKNIRWHNPQATSYQIVEGQGWHDGLNFFYDRLPAKSEQEVRNPVWRLSHETAGLQLRFRTRTTDIHVRYAVDGKLNFPHMPTTGVSGVDLYALDKDGAWQWSGEWSGGFNFADTIKYHYSSLPHNYTKEYHLYLPLYNNVKWLEIGVPDSAKLTFLPTSPNKPIVVYGTSIAQGGVASRPGMAWTAILGRRLHRPVINLGFSGNGRLEKPVANLLTELNPKIYVIDCLPNMGGFPDSTIKNRLTSTVRTLRNERPNVPVIITEDANASIESLDQKLYNNHLRVNKIAEHVFAQLKASGLQHIYLLTSDEIGLDNESTVAGIHPNDYGMELYAKAYENIIREILYEPVGKYSTMRPVRQYRDDSYDWLVRHRKELKMNKTHPPKIVFLGNSITHYWGGIPKAPYHRGEDSWEKYFAPFRVRNFGYGWDRIENVLWRVYHGELDGYKAKQVLINIGTNNLAINTDKEIIAGLKLLIEAVRERQPKSRILIIGIYPCKDREKRVAVLNKKIVRLSGIQNVTYTDPGVKLLNKNDKINTSLFVDGRLHPNAKGYQILAKALAPYLAE